MFSVVEVHGLNGPDVSGHDDDQPRARWEPRDPTSTQVTPDPLAYETGGREENQNGVRLPRRQWDRGPVTLVNPDAADGIGNRPIERARRSAALGRIEALCSKAT